MRKELKIGIFAVSVIVVSFFVLNYLRGEDIFNREIELISRYGETQGLVASAPVHIKGYKAGKVKDVSYDKVSEDFIVTCSILKDFRIPSDSKMTIYSVDLMGGKGVKIDLGTSDIPAADGDTLAPAYEAGLVDGLAGSIGPLMEKVSTTLDSLNITVSGVNSLLSDANKAAISSTLLHLEVTMKNLRGLSASVNGRSEQILSLVDNLSAFSDKLGGIAEKVDTAVAGVDSIIDSLSTADLQGVVSSVKELIDNVNDPSGSIGKLFTDDSVYNSVDSLLNDVDELVSKISENPKKYLKISVF